jgi:hypothetical protein
MSWLEWLLQLVTVALLLAAMPFAVKLHRQLGALRKEGAVFEGGAQGLTEATRLAESASLRLRASAETASRQVGDKLAGAEALRDDIRYLVERAETLADRLEVLLRQGRIAETPVAPPPPPPVVPKAEAPGGQSQAERDLMRALVRGSAGGKG